MNERLKELQDQEKALMFEIGKHPYISINDPKWQENREECIELNKAWDKALNNWLKWRKKHNSEIENLIIAENTKNGVYWDREDWIYDAIKGIEQHYELIGQERTKRFIEDLEKMNGVVITECDAGYNLEIFTPYKVYLYRFNRGYGDYPITIKKGFIAPSGNTYRNKIFLAKNTKDMKARYFEVDKNGQEQNTRRDTR